MHDKIDFPEGEGNPQVTFEFIPNGEDTEEVATFDLADLMGEMYVDVPEEQQVEIEDVAMDVSASSSPPSGPTSDWKRELLEPEFVLKSRDEMADFVLSTRNPNTVKKTGQVVKAFQTWLKMYCLEKRAIENIQPEELDQFISNYLLNKKTKAGGQHQPDTLTSIHRAILRHLRHANYQVDPMTHESFEMSRDILASRRTKLKQEGLGNRPNKSEGFDEEEIEKMWVTGALGASDPETLQNTIYYFLAIGFGLRGCDKSRQMRWGDVLLLEDKDQTPYLQWRERSSKTRQGGEGGHIRAFEPKIYGKVGYSRCPVAYYKEFASKRPQASMSPDAPFYLTVRHGTTLTDDCCYITTPMGVNKLRQVVKVICKKAGIVGRHTNHSLRKTTCQTLMAANVPPTLVAQLSGHKCLGSLNNYSTASKPQQREMSHILTGITSGQSAPTSSLSFPPAKRNPPVASLGAAPPQSLPAAMAVTPANTDPSHVVNSLSSNAAGMFSGAVVNGPITLHINYNIQASTQSNVNMSPTLPLPTNDDEMH